MRAAKWRSALIGRVELIRELRKTDIVPPDNIPDQIDMENDLKRTFPMVLWFTNTRHLGNIETVLKMYAFMKTNYQRFYKKFNKRKDDLLEVYEDFTISNETVNKRIAEYEKRV